MKMYVLVGMVASGKSTFCKTMADRGAIIINDDAVQFILHGGKQRFDVTLEAAYNSAQEQLAETFLNYERDVVIDSTNSTRHNRDRWTTVGHNAGAEVIAVRFPIVAPYIHASRRYTADSRGVPLHVWEAVCERHYGNFLREPLDDSIEDFDQILPPEVVLGQHRV